jgi:hypothetical protein
MLFGLHRQAKQEGSKTATAKAWTRSELAHALQEVESFLSKSRQEWSENDILMQQLVEDRIAATVMAKHQVAPGRNARRVLGSEGLPTPRQTARQRSTIAPTGAEIEDISAILFLARDALEHLTETDCQLVRDGTSTHKVAGPRPSQAALPAHDAAHHLAFIPSFACKSVAALLSYLGNSDAVTRFIAPNISWYLEGGSRKGACLP